MSLSAEEQLLLELINRARLDPTGEAARLSQDSDAGSSNTLSSGDNILEGLPDGPLGVVAGNSLLDIASTQHGEWVLAEDRFTHTGENGSTAGERMEDAGYEFTGVSTWSENLALKGSSGTLDSSDTVHTLHGNLFESDGHRANMLNSLVREVGVSVETGEFYGRDSMIATQNFARSGEERFVTGVAYEDRDGDDFYSIGEGVAGVRIAAAGNSTTTSASGGYSLSLGADGTTPMVSITSDDVLYQMRIVDKVGNVKIDIVDAETIASSASLVLSGATQNAILLGSGDLSLKGRAGDNALTGNSGDNLLVGRRGHDELSGGDGNDLLKGGGGRDTLDGGAGDDVLRTGQGSDTLSGGAGEDQLFGGGGDDLLTGGAGHDILKGHRGNDAMDGGAGDDWLAGGGGSDTLDGGAGNDRLVGGGGADSFVFAQDGGHDVVAGFSKGNDRILLDEGLWSEFLTAEDVVSHHAQKVGGSVVFTFEGGEKLTLEDVSSLSGLADTIDLI